jgi:DNA-binding response OmpR family regulator
MGKRFSVHVFCLKPDICRLIKKTVSGARYEVTCTSADTFTEQILDELKQKFDCIIIDRGITSQFRERIRMRYHDIPVICLPSLDTEMSAESGVKYMEEPLRLSELVKVLDEVLREKEN